MRERVYEQDTAMSTATQHPDTVVLWREHGRPACNLPLVALRHSQTGIEWGYGGAGPADLALNILLAFTDRETALDLYQAFKWAFIAHIPSAGGEIPAEAIRAWIATERQVTQ